MRGLLSSTATLKFAMETYASVTPAGGRIVKKKGIDEANLTKRGKGFKRMFCSSGTFAHVGDANVAVYTRGAAGSLIKALTDLPPGRTSSNMDLAHGKFKIISGFKIIIYHHCGA